MSVSELIEHLRRLDIHLWAEGEQLRFNAPQGVFSAELRSQVVARKPELLELLCRRMAFSAPIPRVPRHDALTLSFAQQRLLFLDRLEPDSPAYNVFHAVEARGDLRPAVLARSLDLLIERHETLRTVFTESEGRPVQRIAPGGLGGLALVDLRELEGRDSAAAAAEVERWMGREARCPFDLERGPLLRLTVLRRGPGFHVLLLTMHHIVSDGWSIGLFVRELAQVYHALDEGIPLPMPPLPIQYADFASWQRGLLESGALEPQLAFWKERLAGAPPVLSLPTDHPRPVVLDSRGQRLSFSWPPPLTSGVEALADRLEATPFVVLLAGFQALLARLSSQWDVVVGSPVAGRNRTELEGLIGVFVNTLLHRTRVEPDLSFETLVRQVRESVFDAQSHQDLPFELLVDALRPERDLSHNPLFQVMLAFQNAPAAPLEMPGLSLIPLAVDPGTARFDLLLTLWRKGDRLEGWLEFKTALFHATTAVRLIEHLRILLADAARGPARAVADLALLADAERHQLLAEWNDPADALGVGLCLHTLIDAQVERAPDTVALTCGEVALTYRELGTRADRLARSLAALGVGPESFVGLCAERSPEMLVALLAILKAGGAYVPLDPSIPRGRLAFLLEDARPAAVLTQERLLERLPADIDAPVICLDRDLPFEAADLPVRVDPGHPAYAIYTSGSTGKPKGVVNSHSGVVNRLLWMIAEHGIGPGDVFLQKTPFSFDVSVWELFTPLMVGARLVVARHGGHQDAAYLVNVIAAERVTLLHFVPSMLLAFLEEPGLERCTAVRAVMCSGEALPDELQQRFFARLPGPELYNLYGPTEAAVEVTVWTCRPEAARRPVPIGRPIAGVRIHLLDPWLRLVPCGVAGELHIGGVALARGYLDRPDLTAEKFIPDPFAERAGGRLYRTGDLARHLPDGAVDYLGRLDHQVKIRGIRIELGEIEQELCALPGVREAAVGVRGAAAPRLVAWVVPTAGTEPGDLSTAALRDALRERLPDAMVPASWVVLPAMPLLTSGKVDRKRLPEPAAPSVAAAPWSPPRTFVEKTLAAIWAEVLRLERVGLHDNFFSLGGDSILSIQVTSRARRAGIGITPRLLFQYQTVAGLAAVASLLPASGADESATGPVPLLPAQRWFFAAALADPHHFNQAVLLKIERQLDPAGLAAALALVMRHHDALRTRFWQTPEGWHQEIPPPAPEGEAPFAQVDLSALPVAAHASAIENVAAQAQTGFDLAAGRLHCLVRLELGAEWPGRLLWVIHHLVVDGVSWRVLWEDLMTAHDQIQRLDRRGPVTLAVLPSKTTPLRSWAEALARTAASPALQAELRFWTDLPWEEAGRLPVDLAAAPEADTVGAERSVLQVLDLEATRALLQEVPRAYNTQIDDALLSALARAVLVWTGSPLLPLDLEGHGREEDLLPGIDLARTVGWLTSIYPVLLDLRAGADPGSALVSVKEGLRRIPRGGIGYGLLRYGAAVGGELAALPRPEILFNYLGQLDQALPTDSGLRPAREAIGAARSTWALRSHRFEIAGWVLDGRLHLICRYSHRVHHRETVERLMKGLDTALRELIAWCASLDSEGFTASDYPAARLSPEDLGVLARRLGGERPEDLYELSPLQQGLLFHALFAPESGEYCEQLSCELEGDLDELVLQGVWDQVVQRHPVLRTDFQWDGLEKPVQRVRRQVLVPWEKRDLRALPAVEREAQLAAFLHDDRRRPFDLAHAPLLRLALLRSGDRSWQFVLTFHHLLMDGWCLPLLVREVFTLYAAERRGESLQLPLRGRYRDYIAWLQRQDAVPAEAFWRRDLAGFTAPTPLPGDSGRTNGAEPDERELALPVAASEALRAFARTHCVTANTLVQAAWALVLARSSAVRDVVFGTTVSGRPPELPGSEEIIGLFINTLPVRVMVEPRERLHGWLERLQRRDVEARQLEYVPLVQIQGWSDVPRGTPLFESLLNFESYPVDELRPEAAGVEVRSTRLFEWTHYPLVFLAIPGERLRLRLAFDPCRFEAVAMERMLGHVRTLLEGMSAGTDREIWELPWLGAEEAAQLLAWNATAQACPATSADRLFAEQVARTPGAVAAVCDGVAWTYAELERQAERQAHRLIRAGVVEETIVAILAERGLDFLAAVLGVWKSGAAYLPLDPLHPAERHRQILSQARPILLLAAPALAPVATAVAAPLGVSVQELRPEPREDGACAHRRYEPLADPDRLSYVIYTSGSTGLPKGAMVAHRGMINHLWAKITTLDLTAADAVAQTASQCFDISVWQLTAALMVGGRVHIYPDQIAHDPSRLLEAVAADGVSILETVPSLMRTLLEEIQQFDGSRPLLPALRWLIPTGEALPPELCRAWAAAYPEIPLLNAYGPTECSDDVSHHPIRAGDVTEGAATVPIGHPVINTQLHLLDAALLPVPVEVQGEIWVGGDGVGRGYRFEPHRTAQVFLPDPFAVAAGRRMYRTGDLGCRRTDGALEFLGRIDHQVKIRGFRIEIGEIEQALFACPGVRHAAVLARGDGAEKRLVAYVVLAEEVEVSALRRVLGERLPDYMVPAVWVVLPEMPLLSSGKVDRKALPEPESPAATGAASVAPSTPLEAELAALWTEVLRVKRVGIHDNFFALGGDSILSIQITSRARSRGIGLSPRLLFQHQTIAELAAAIGTAAATPVAGRETVAGRVSLTPVQRLFLDADLIDPHHFNQTVLLETARTWETAASAAALGLLVRHHDALRLRFRRGESGWEQRSEELAAAEDIPCARVDLAALPEQRQREAVEAVAAASQGHFDLTAGPVQRLLLLYLGEGRPGRLLWVIHHLVVDGVSWRLLLEDLAVAVDCLSRGEMPRLPDKTTSFQAWSERLAGLAASPELEEELVFWRALPWSAVAPLPRDSVLVGAPPAGTVASERRAVLELDAEETRVLLQQVPRAYNTHINDVLLTALARALQAWSGSSVQQVDLEGHGREEIFPDVELSRTVGWFTSVFPVLLDLRESEGPGSALRAIKEQLRAIPRGGLGFGVLRWLSGAGSELAALPQAEVGFNYLGQLDQALSETAGLRPAGESTGPARSPRAPRSYLLEWNAGVLGGRLRLVCLYSEMVHRQETLERLLGLLGRELRALIRHCMAAEAGGYTPSDFPTARLRQAELDRLAARLRDSLGGLEDLYELSPMQQGILLHTLVAPGSGVYCGQLTCTLEGDLDPAVLRRAWDTVVHRHPVLRTDFLWEDTEKPLQRVHRRIDISWSEEDWRGDADPQARWKAFLSEDRSRGFLPRAAPLLRLTLVRTGASAWFFAFSYHQTLLDGWCLPLLLREVFAIYEAFRQGREPRLPLPPPYRRYIAWLQQQSSAVAEAFWRRELAGIVAATPLPGDRATGTGAPTAVLEVSVSAPATEALQAFARRQRLTLNTLVQGAWSLLLARHSGERDVVWGATVSGRPADLPGSDTMIGLFINTLPVRATVEPRQPILDWLAQLQARHVEARQLEYSPLVQVQGWSTIPRGTPLFESLVIFENYPVDESLRAGAAGVRIGGTRFFEFNSLPMTLFALPGQELTLRLGFDPGRFEPADVMRTLIQLRTLLEGVPAGLEQTLWDIPLLTAAEREQALVEWNDTAAACPDANAHSLFAAQAARTPQAVAAISGGEVWSYAELNRQAEALAERLAKQGVREESVVPILAERSLAFLAGVLGVWKAGAAYLPLDPRHPADRHRQILEQVHTTLILVTPELAPVVMPLAVLRALPVLELRLEEAGAAAPPRRLPSLPDDPRRLAYVIYTSGSTGVPKGAMVVQQGMVNHLWAKISALRLTEADVVAQTASQCFDISVWQLIAPLLVGGCVHIYPDEIAHDPSRLLERIEADGISILETVPSLLRALLEDVARRGAARPSLANLRWMIPTGEALPPELCRDWAATYPAIPLLNAYGPTECSDDVSHCLIPAGSLGNEVYVPIGRPILNTWLWLLDSELQPVPIGVKGEIWVSGDCVGRGYLQAPRRTAQVFLPDPFASEPGRRMYRTGDLGRRRPDGVLEFLGRIDHQVKIRGFRIELGEIEAILEEHPQVAAAVVLVQQDRLVGCVVPALAEPDSQNLRSFLRQRLPEPMVPTGFLFLPELPLTANKKIDRAALAIRVAREGAGLAPTDVYVAPRNEVEEALCGFFAEVLGGQQIGVLDDFFERGGHSLLATQVVLRIRDAFEVTLTLQAFFDTPRVADLAEQVEHLIVQQLEMMDDDQIDLLVSEREQDSALRRETDFGRRPEEDRDEP